MRRKATLSSPVGDLLAIADGARLTHLLFADGEDAASAGEGLVNAAMDAPFAELVGQLGEYFSGQRQSFDLALEPSGTPFQRMVWAELERIPYGLTISYGELAGRIGKPNAVRAVGGANHRNPLAIVVPCHRVIGADSTMVGYGGGLPRKRALLELEGAPIMRQLALL